MNKIKTIQTESYQTTDGEIFTTKKKAKEYQDYINMKEIKAIEQNDLSSQIFIEYAKILKINTPEELKLVMKQFYIEKIVNDTEDSLTERLPCVILVNTYCQTIVDLKREANVYLDEIINYLK